MNLLDPLLLLLLPPPPPAAADAEADAAAETGQTVEASFSLRSSLFASPCLSLARVRARTTRIMLHSHRFRAIARLFRMQISLLSSLSPFAVIRCACLLASLLHPRAHTSPPTPPTLIALAPGLPTLALAQRASLLIVRSSAHFDEVQ